MRRLTVAVTREQRTITTETRTNDGMIDTVMVMVIFSALVRSHQSTSPVASAS